MMRITYIPGLLFAMLLVQIAATGQTEQSSGNRPNILLICLDDWGYGDMGITGATGFETPHLNRLAKEGTFLTHYYAPQAVCSASRLGLLTGCYPNRLGFHGALDHASTIGIHPAEITIAELLKPLGYATAALGKWHLGHTPEFMPLRHGFDEFYGIPYSNDMWPNHPTAQHYYPPLPLIEGEHVVATNPDQAQFTTQFTERTIRFIEQHKQQPFFIYLAHPMPHVPLFVSEKFKGKSKQGLYGDVMMELDWSIGEVVKKLDATGLAQKTLVIVTSDNGPWLTYGNHAGSNGGLREGKGTTFEGGQRVPCIIRWPGKIRPGWVSDGIASGLDLLPTIAAITGTVMPAHKTDGVNLWPLLSGKTSESPRQTFLYYYRKNNLEAIRHGHWKLVFAHHGRSYSGQKPGADGMPGNAPEQVPVEAGLYDLRRDPGEQYNLIRYYPKIAAKLNALAEEAREDLGDDLTGKQGKNRRPAGGSSNK